MDYKLKLFILACAVTGSLSILCERCADNFFDPGLINCSVPVIRNCSVYDNGNCQQGSPDYDNCTRDTVLACFNGTFVYTDDNGTQQTGYIRDCAFPSSADALVCSQENCNDAAGAFNQTNNTLISCAADCCFSDNCNQVAAPPATGTPTTGTPITNGSISTDGAGQTTTGVSGQVPTSTTSDGTPSTIVQVSCPYFVGLLWLGVVALF